MKDFALHSPDIYYTTRELVCSLNMIKWHSRVKWYEM